MKRKNKIYVTTADPADVVSSRVQNLKNKKYNTFFHENYFSTESIKF